MADSAITSTLWGFAICRSKSGAHFSQLGVHGVRSCLVEVVRIRPDASLPLAAYGLRDAACGYQTGGRACNVLLIMGYFCP